MANSITMSTYKQKTKSWLVHLAKLGYAAKGVVYLIVGGIALWSAFGSGSLVGPSGALDYLTHAPFGRSLLILVALGLLAYAVWRFVQAGMDTENEGSDASGSVKRLGYAVSGLTYTILAGSVLIGVISSLGNSSNSDSAQQAASTLMQQPFGVFLVALLGVIIAGLGLYQLYRAYKATFRSKLTGQHTWVVRLGRAGFAARGIVYSIMAGFFVSAAINQNANQAGGIREALQTLEQQAYGPWLLATVAVGLALYGLFNVLLARYRRIDIARH